MFIVSHFHRDSGSLVSLTPGGRLKPKVRQDSPSGFFGKNHMALNVPHSEMRMRFLLQINEPASSQYLALQPTDEILRATSIGHQRLPFPTQRTVISTLSQSSYIAQSAFRVEEPTSNIPSLPLYAQGAFILHSIRLSKAQSASSF
jgi:hypothetical protein